MSRKQLYVDWETLNRLIQAKNKKKATLAMPGNIWYDGGPQEIEVPAAPAWADEQLLQDIQRVFEEEQQNAREKVVSVSEKHHQEAAEGIRESLVIEPVDGKTVVVAVVIDTENQHHNVPKHIHCQDGIGFGGYVRDVPKDAYIVDCVDYVTLGTIPVCFNVSLPHTGGWKMPLPMSDKVIEKLLPPYYKRTLKVLREKYPKPKFEVHYMQMLGCG
jgi:hypothetical protein